MLVRLFSVLAVVFVLSACSSDQTGDTSAQSGMDGRDAMTAGPLDGTQVDGDNMGGAAPGTQADLVVNVGDRVFFGYDQYDLTPEGRSTLDMQSEWLQKYPNVNVTIEGHCDERGTREYNLALGERRASSIKNYLIARGVPASRVNTISYGKERPAVPGSDASAWAQNRRGVTKVD